MSLQQEILLERLLPKYERRFGKPPPIDASDLESVITLRQHALAETSPSVVTTRRESLERVKVDS